MSVLTRKEVMRRLRVTSYQLRESHKSHYLGPILAPQGVHIRGRWRYHVREIEDFERRRVEFREKWYSKERLVERLGLGRISQLNYRLYVTREYNGVKLPRPAVVVRGRIYFAVADIEEYEAAVDRLYLGGANQAPTRELPI